MGGRGDILIIDDDENALLVYEKILTDGGFNVETAKTGEEGLERLYMMGGADVILLDQNMPGISGMETLQNIQEMNGFAQVIMITACSEVSNVVSAIKQGAYDYLVKPVDYDQLRLAIDRAIRLVTLERENKRLKEVFDEGGGFHGIMTCSRDMKKILEKAKNISLLDSTVLISGESGTGKELMARAIHENSHRREGPFIAVNCAAFPEDLLTSALFGFEKGAFTGAINTSKGCFEEAHGGTLFLDEVGEMSPKLQASLLRVLQEREFCRIGSYKHIPVDFRLITATNKDLKKEVDEGRYREDLFYRLNVVPVALPPLRERKEDIPMLAEHFLRKVNSRFGKNIGPFDKEAIEALNGFYWQGNCRELENVIERIVAVKQKGEIDLGDLPEYIRGGKKTKKTMGRGNVEPFAAEKQRFEKEYLEQALMESNGNISRMSKLTGIPRPNLYDKLKKHDLR